MTIQNIIKKSAVLIGSLAITSSALALSCVQPNFAESFNRLNEVEETYWVGYGVLEQHGAPIEITPPDYPTHLKPNDPALINHKKPKVYNAIFDGGFLDGNTVVQNKRYNVRVETQCLGPWCGGFPSSPQPQMLMIEMTAQGMRMKMGPCGGDHKQSPTAAQIEVIQACLRFGGCRESEKAAFRF